MYPKMYLSIDNCFASKRWTAPGEWMDVVRELGLACVEASADNECDPLYTTPDYLLDWTAQVRDASRHSGVRVTQLYSGHGTYATLGLCHPDRRIREHILQNWLKPMCRLAGSLDAALGFFCHALGRSTLADPASHSAVMEELYRQLAQVACWGDAFGCRSVGVETMYTPHQPPWTLAGAAELLREVSARAGKPFYLTVDVGHQVGQQHFLGDGGGDRPYFRARPEDGSTARWLEEFGCYSPIVHLQQTDGNSSRHLPFTEENRRTGTVTGEGVLAALRRSYDRPQPPGMPARTAEIYLTLEIFSGTADREREILARLRESVAYWRRFVPRDGLSLDTLAPAGAPA